MGTSEPIGSGPKRIMEQVRQEQEFDISRLQQMIDTVGMQVDREPDNTAARLRLAWCFLGRALYRVGQTSVVPAVPLSDGDADTLELLQKCLHQVTVVRQISLQSHEQQEAQMLYSLIGMANGHQVTQKSDDEANAILQNLMVSLRSASSPRSSLEPRHYPRRQHHRR
ncbi:MAG: hypothetical protein QM758_20240 [Armatimonas sp.]